MFDRLVSRTVLAQADRIVRHDVDHAQAHQRRQANGRTRIVGEDEERAAVGNEPAVQGDAVHAGGHRLLAGAVMDVAAGEVAAGDGREVGGLRVVGPREVCRAADRRGHGAVHHLQRRLRRLARGHGLRILGEATLERGDLAVQLRRNRAVERRFEGRALRRAGETGLPRLARRASAPARCPPRGGDSVRHLERRVRPVQRVARAVDLFRAERRAVARRGALPRRRAEADDGAARHQRRPVGLDGARERRADRRRIVAVARLDVPAGGGEARQLVVRHGKIGRPVDRHPVVVEQHRELVQAEMSGERDRLVAHAFHETAVAGDGPGAVVDEVVAVARGREALGERHADGVADSLAEGAGGRLDPRGEVVLRVAGGAAAEAAKAPQLAHVHVGVAGQMQDRVEQHRAVAGRKTQPVAVGPLGRRGVELQKLAHEHGGHVGHAHGHSRVARRGGFHGVHRQRANCIGQGRVTGLGRRPRFRVHA